MLQVVEVGLVTGGELICYARYVFLNIGGAMFLYHTHVIRRWSWEAKDFGCG